MTGLTAFRHLRSSQLSLCTQYSAPIQKLLGLKKCPAAYNGPYALLGCQFMPKVGAHDGDWERLTVRLGAPDFGLQVCLLSCCTLSLPCRPSAC